MERVRCMAIAGVVFVHRLLDGLMGLGAIYLGPVPGVPASRAGLHVGFHKRRRLVAEPVEQEARRAVTASLHSAGASLAARQSRWIQEAVCLHQIFVGKSAFSTQHGASTNAGNNQRQCRWLLRTIQRPPRDSAADAVHASAAPLREAGRAVQHAFAVSSFALMRGGRRAFAGLMLHRRESHLPPATDDNPCVVVTATTPRLTAAATRNTKVLCVPTWRMAFGQSARAGFAFEGFVLSRLSHFETRSLCCDRSRSEREEGRRKTTAVVLCGRLRVDVHLGFLPGVPCDLNQLHRNGSGRAHLNPPNSGSERNAFALVT